MHVNIFTDRVIFYNTICTYMFAKRMFSPILFNPGLFWNKVTPSGVFRYTDPDWWIPDNHAARDTWLQAARQH